MLATFANHNSTAFGSLSTRTCSTTARGGSNLGTRRYSCWRLRSARLRATKSRMVLCAVASRTRSRHCKQSPAVDTRSLAMSSTLQFLCSRYILPASVSKICHRCLCVHKTDMIVSQVGCETACRMCGKQASGPPCRTTPT